MATMISSRMRFGRLSAAGFAGGDTPADMGPGGHLKDSRTNLWTIRSPELGQRGLQRVHRDVECTSCA